MNRIELIEKLNGLCWSARRYGHDDYGLDDAVDEHGEPMSADADYGYHPDAVIVADEILAAWAAEHTEYLDSLHGHR